MQAQQFLARLALVGLACHASLALAQDDSAGPQRRDEGGYSYKCGGVGATEAASMKREAGHYQLMLTFAERSGAYLADVHVHVADPRAQSVLDTTCDGPIMLLNFPRAGSYHISAEAQGQRRDTVVTVGRAHGRSLALLWPHERSRPQG